MLILFPIYGLPRKIKVPVYFLPLPGIRKKERENEKKKKSQLNLENHDPWTENITLPLLSVQILVKLPHWAVRNAKKY